MATRYLLACSCGRHAEVEAGQAGDRISCDCGNSLAVPKLRQLRGLPRVDTQVDTTQQRSSWTTRHRLITLGSIVAVISLGIGVHAWVTAPSPDDYEPAPEIAEVEAYYERLNPVRTWQHWLSQTVPLAQQGLQEEVTVESLAFQQKIEEARKRQLLAFSTAGVAMLICLAAALWR